MANPINAILFDLDGTLIDTAPDLVSALNHIRHERNLPALPLAAVRSMVSQGSKTMLKALFNIEENDPILPGLRQRFLDLYKTAETTQLFPGIEQVLTYLDQQQLPWGIVTNKLTIHTNEVLQTLQLYHRAACIICGDTLAKHKPDPEPVLHACELLQQEPQHCLFIGDSIVDVTASKAAGTRTLVALYGYIGTEEDPHSWQADGYIQEPVEIITWLEGQVG